MNRSRFQPFLVPEDLGINIEEDSPDFTEADAAEAVDTSSMEEFVRLAADFVKESGGGEPHYERRIRSGIFYCRILVGSRRRIYRIEWVRR